MFEKPLIRKQSRTREQAQKTGQSKQIEGTEQQKKKGGAPYQVSVVMGSQSDWGTMKQSVEMLTLFGVRHEYHVVSAHRTPDLLFDYASQASARGLQVIIAGAGGAAHLPGMIASKTTLPVLGVPIQSRAMNGMDSLYSIVQMPAGIPVGCLAIGTAGAKNAALLAIQILALTNPELQQNLQLFRKRQSEQVIRSSLTL